MAALTDAMKWYKLGGQTTARLKYHFKVEFFSSQYQAPTATAPALQGPARLIFDCIRSVELPKYSIETEVINSWNIRHHVPTRINFEPISISFVDTLDNRFLNFMKSYLGIISGSFQPAKESFRTGFGENHFGIKKLEKGKDAPIDRIVITQFYGSDNKRTITLWRPKIVDVQHDTLDYSTSEAVTWQISFRYESVTYDDGASADIAKSEKTQTQTATNPNANAFVKQAQDQIALNQKMTEQAAAASGFEKQAQQTVNPAAALNGLSFKEASAVAKAQVANAVGGFDRGTRGGV